MPPNDEGTPHNPAAARQLRVLCAEDHEQVADLLRLVLTRSGHLVDCATDGEDAWRKMQAAGFRYDVLITDHVMPERDGLQLVRAVRERGYSGVVIVQSARLTPQTRADYTALGITRFIEKPVRPDLLRNLLGDVSAPPKG
jgi:DNA-binding response OmpR family regulator